MLIVGVFEMVTSASISSMHTLMLNSNWPYFASLSEFYYFCRLTDMTLTLFPYSFSHCPFQFWKHFTHQLYSWYFTNTRQTFTNWSTMGKEHWLDRFWASQIQPSYPKHLIGSIKESETLKVSSLHCRAASRFNFNFNRGMTYFLTILTVCLWWYVAHFYILNVIPCKPSAKDECSDYYDGGGESF